MTIRRGCVIAKCALDARRRSLKYGALVAALSVFPMIANAEVTFTFTYTDPVGVGFNDAVQGAARRAALEQATQLLSNALPGYNANIMLTIDGAATSDNLLASAGSEFTETPTSCNPGFGIRGDVGVKVLGGADPDPDGIDGNISVNFEDPTWGLGDNITPPDFDFKNVMLHELVHALGFSKGILESGRSPCNQAVGTPGAWDPYDGFLGDTSSDVINDATFILDGPRWAAIATGGAGTAGILWRGPQGVAANGNQPVPLFSPAPFRPLSSVSHLDDDFFTNDQLLMKAGTGPGPGPRRLSDIEIGMLRDLGFANATNGGGGGGGGDDHGDSCAAASAAAVGSTLNGVLEPNTDVDYFRFELSGSATVTAEASSQFDSFGILYDASCVEIARDDDGPDGDNNRNFRIERMLSAGTYFLQVSSFMGQTGGGYQVALTSSGGGGDDHGNSCAAATAATVGSTLNGVVEPNDDLDFFRFTLSGSATLTAEADAQFDSFGILYDANCVEIARDDDSASNRNFRIQQALNAGTYFLRVSSFSNGPGGAYEVSLTSSGGGGGGGGAVNEPRLDQAALPAPNPPNPSCPSGYFTVTIEDGPGSGVSNGQYGMELLLDAPGTRDLQGGLNFGGLIDVGQVGFAGANIANPAGENQRLNISLTGRPLSGTGSLPVRITIARDTPSGRVTVYENSTSLNLAPAFEDSVVVEPGYYLSTVAVEGFPASGVGGAPEGQFFFELTTQFVDRVGGGFQGGAVVGGYHASNPLDPNGASGFAAFCISTPHTTTVKVLSTPSYGNGGGDLRLRVKDINGNTIHSVPEG